MDYLDEEGDHGQGQVGVRIVQVFDDTLGPLEALLAEGAPAVQRHHRGQVLHLFALFGADLQ